MSHKPAWWVLYVLVLLLGGLSLADREFIVSLLAQEVVEFGILLLVFGLMALWVHTNAQGIARMDAQERGAFRIISDPPPQGEKTAALVDKPEGRWN